MDVRGYVLGLWWLSCFIFASIRSLPLYKINEYFGQTESKDVFRTFHSDDIPQFFTAEPPDKPGTDFNFKHHQRFRRSASTLGTVSSVGNFDDGEVTLVGLRFESADREPSYDEDGTPNILVGTLVALRLFGRGFTNHTQVAVTEVPGPRGASCQFPAQNFFTVVPGSMTESSVQVRIRLPESAESGKLFYLCTRRAASLQWQHAGDSDEPWLQVRAFRKMLPLWLSVVIIVFLLALSGLFSGLNLGLMALDRTELKIVVNTGTETERRHARAIEPVRAHGNYLLCSLLLGNVLVNSTLTILMDELTSGPVAVLGSTMAIVIFGEIVPQAICSRHGLAVGARTVYVTKLFMLLTFPLSYPVSLLLDRILGKEIGNVYNRERLKELIKVTNEYNDLEKEEVNIISGALEMREKIVFDVMTRIDDAFMLPEDAILDFETLSEIREQGYSRIPVHQKGKRCMITSILYTKDLAFVDSRLNMPVSAFCKFHPRDCNFVFGDTKLDVMLKTFREGNKGHMAFVTEVNTEGDGDPFYEVLGLVTLEDIIEEMIKAEIVDETDVWTDNRSKRRRNRGNYDLSVFLGKRPKQKYVLSPQLTLAAFQFLSTSVSPFCRELVTLTALRKLLEEDVNVHVKLKSKTSLEPTEHVLYEKGKAADCFILILEGLVEVSIGNENMIFIGRPFTSFGKEFFLEISESPLVVTPPSVPEAQPVTFLPDYTVRAKTELTYLCVPVSLYIAAVRATKMERLREEKGDDLDITQFILGRSQDDPVASPASELASEGASQQDLDVPASSEGSSSQQIPVAVPAIQSGSQQEEASSIPREGTTSPTPPSPTESEGLLPTSTQF